MPEFNLIPEARSAPTSCFLCGEFAGPFVASNIEKIEGTVILCAPAYEPTGELKRSGCVGQIAEAAHYVDPLTHGLNIEASERQEQQLRDELADLESELDAARAEVPPAVDLQPVFERIDSLETRLVDALGKVEKAKAPAKPKEKQLVAAK